MFPPEHNTEKYPYYSEWKKANVTERDSLQKQKSCNDSMNHFIDSQSLFLALE